MGAMYVLPAHGPRTPLLRVHYDVPRGDEDTTAAEAVLHLLGPADCPNLRDGGDSRRLWAVYLPGGKRRGGPLRGGLVCCCPWHFCLYLEHDQSYSLLQAARIFAELRSGREVWFEVYAQRRLRYLATQARLPI